MVLNRSTLLVPLGCGANAKHVGRRRQSAVARIPVAKKSLQPSIKRTRIPVVETTSISVVGCAAETEVEHRARHSHQPLSCARCKCARYRDAWLMKYGSFGHDARGRRERVVWFSERPARLGGEWAVGCLICAAMLHRLSSEPGTGAKSARKVLSTRMGRFEVRSLNSMQASVIAQHANATCHKKAVAMWLQPGDPVRIALQSTPEDDALLRGGVPQPVDWLRTWRALRTPASFEAAAAAAETEHFICSMRHRPVQPRGLLAMATIQSEVVREHKRAVPN